MTVADFLGALLWPPLTLPLASQMDNSEEKRLVLYSFICISWSRSLSLQGLDVGALDV